VTRPWTHSWGAWCDLEDASLSGKKKEFKVIFFKLYMLHF
jgi:hypothetical protein